MNTDFLYFCNKYKSTYSLVMLNKNMIVKKIIKINYKYNLSNRL